ncbi:MAG: hypothetical protein M9894_16080 [Planctomycetes bacterium]|nr:hypothetical protein [Planctomycetota bacterium]
MPRRDVPLVEAAEALGISTYALCRLVGEGCPADHRTEDGARLGLWFDPAEVQAWIAAEPELAARVLPEEPEPETPRFRMRVLDRVYLPSTVDLVDVAEDEIVLHKAAAVGTSEVVYRDLFVAPQCLDMLLICPTGNVELCGQTPDEAARLWWRATLRAPEGVVRREGDALVALVAYRPCVVLFRDGRWDALEGRPEGASQAFWAEVARAYAALPLWLFDEPRAGHGGA